MSSQHALYVVSFLKRRSDLTKEEFFQHWENVHARLVAPWAVKSGCIEYYQLHVTSDLHDKLQSVSGPALKVDDYDGVVIWQLEDFDRFKEAFVDPYFLEVVLPDEDNFLRKESTRTIQITTLGLQKKIISGGKSLVEIPEKWKQGEKK